MFLFLFLIVPGSSLYQAQLLTLLVGRRVGIDASVLSKRWTQKVGRLDQGVMATLPKHNMELQFQGVRKMVVILCHIHTHIYK